MEHKQTSVLWVAPQVEGLPELGFLKELGRLNTLDIDLKILTGPEIDLADVALALREQRDILLFSGHGGPKGLILRGGQLIKPKWLASKLENLMQPSLAIIAACSSQGSHFPVPSMSSAISAVGIDAIGFPAEADDAGAATFSLATVEAYAAGETGWGAFAVGYEAVEDTELARGLEFLPGTNQTKRAVEIRLAAMEKAITGLSDLIRAKAEWGRFVPALGMSPRTASDAIRGIAPQAAGADDAEGAASPQVDGE